MKTVHLWKKINAVFRAYYIQVGIYDFFNNVIYKS